MFVGAEDSVRPNSAKRCHSEPVTVALAWEYVLPKRETDCRVASLLAMTRCVGADDSGHRVAGVGIRFPSRKSLVKITTIRRQILCTAPKYENFAGNGCVMHWETPAYKAEGTSVTFDETMTGTVDGKIDVYCYSDSGVVRPVVDGGATLTIMGGTFVNSGLTLEQFKAFVPTGYTVTTNTDGSFTVSK